MYIYRQRRGLLRLKEMGLRGLLLGFWMPLLLAATLAILTRGGSFTGSILSGVPSLTGASSVCAAISSMVIKVGIVENKVGFLQTCFFLVGDGGGRPLSVPCASKGEAVLRRRFKEVVAAANRKTKERDDIQAKLAVANARISQLESTTHWTDTIRGQQNIIDGLQARIQELENCKSTDDMDDFVLAKIQEIMRLRKANAQRLL